MPQFVLLSTGVGALMILLGLDRLLYAKMPKTSKRAA
jgi:hypothetical protein